ncbi:hypothetical protein [Klebsiella pneumoniae]|uniref:hypothetical protein n=1 Tax=Klebsiella pneumoniae TaxID=573 RepID=UPI0022B03310|nr:hypothetical protein [Klebsiella pneumoniae]MCZ3467273.1 hypothetical protein [Klebsiella pneumoniae]
MKLKKLVLFIVILLVIFGYFFVNSIFKGMIYLIFDDGLVNVLVEVIKVLN